MIIGLIPARAGSKGVKDKNIKELGGSPLIAYSIKAALGSSCLDKVIVSTDGQNIANIARKFGAEVPFLRPEELATDKASDFPVMKHCVEWIQKSEGRVPNIVVYLRPTTPFKTSKMIDEAVEKLLKDTSLTGVRSVTRSEADLHPFWMFKEKNGRLSSFVDGVNIKDYYQRQLLPTCFRLNGVVDVIRVENLMRDEQYGHHVGFYEVDEKQSLDIDTPMDYKICEIMMSEAKNEI